MEKIRVLTALLTLSLFSTTACKPKVNTISQVQVTNGILTKNGEFPEVLMLISETGRCTGTFVNDHQMLTAAHCVQDAKELSVGEPRLGSPLFGIRTIAKAESWVIHPNFLQQLDSTYDLALVNFPKGTSPGKFAKISSQGAALAENVLIVGYGNSVIDRQLNQGQLSEFGSGFKRQGVNKIEARDQGLLRFFGFLSEQEAKKRNLKPGQRALSAEGDSGGPMFNARGEIIGISSAAEPSVTGSGQILNYWSLYVDLSSDSSKSFLKDLKN